MGEEQRTADPDMRALEGELRRLPDVAAVRVVTDDIGDTPVATEAAPARATAVRVPCAAASRPMEPTSSGRDR